MQIQITIPDDLKDELVTAIANKVMESVSAQITSKLAEPIPKVETTFSTEKKASPPPTLEMVQKLIESQGYTIDALRFWSYYENLNWKTKNGVPISSWKDKLKEWQSKMPQNIVPVNGGQIPEGYHISCGKLVKNLPFDPNSLDGIEEKIAKSSEGIVKK